VIGINAPANYGGSVAVSDVTVNTCSSSRTTACKSASSRGCLFTAALFMYAQIAKVETRSIGRTENLAHC